MISSSVETRKTGLLPYFRLKADTVFEVSSSVLPPTIFGRELTEWSDASCGQKVIPRDQDNSIDRQVQLKRHLEIRSVQERSVGAGVEHGSQTEDSDDDFFLYSRPIERVIRIFTWLRRQHDVSVATFAVF